MSRQDAESTSGYHCTTVTLRTRCRIGRRPTPSLPNESSVLRRSDTVIDLAFRANLNAARETHAGIAGRIVEPRPVVPLRQMTNRRGWGRPGVRHPQIGIPRMRRWLERLYYGSQTGSLLSSVTVKGELTLAHVPTATPQEHPTRVPQQLEPRRNRY